MGLDTTHLGVSVAADSLGPVWVGDEQWAPSTPAPHGSSAYGRARLNPPPLPRPYPTFLWGGGGGLPAIGTGPVPAGHRERGPTPCVSTSRFPLRAPTRRAIRRGRRLDWARPSHKICIPAELWIPLRLTRPGVRTHVTQKQSMACFFWDRKSWHDYEQCHKWTGALCRGHAKQTQTSSCL